MIFFLAFPLLAFALGMLTAAAFTFAITASVPKFQRYAITAPITAFLISPSFILPASLAIYSRIYLADPPFGSQGFWIRSGTAFVLLTAGCGFVSWLANLVCRTIFEFIPGWLATNFGIRSHLLVQASIAVGGSLSVLVLLAAAGALAILVRTNLAAVVACGATGLIGSTLCVRAILRIPQPESYQPKPVPRWMRNFLVSQP